MLCFINAFHLYIKNHAPNQGYNRLTYTLVYYIPDQIENLIYSQTATKLQNKGKSLQINNPDYKS